MAGYVVGLVAVFGVLVVVAVARPGVFAFVVDDAAIEDRLDRRLLLGAVLVVWAVGWPVTVVVVGVRAVRGRR